MLAYNPLAYVDRRFGTSVQGPFFQLQRAFHFAGFAYAYVAYPGCACDAGAAAYAAPGRAAGIDVSAHYAVHPGDELRPVAVECRHVCFVGGETVMDNYFPSSGFVEHGHVHTVAEASLSFGGYDAHVIYEAVFAYIVVSYVSVNAAYAAVVAYGNVVERGVVYAGMAYQTAGQRKSFFEASEPYPSAETYIADVPGAESFPCFYLAPVFGAASLLLKCGDFFRIEFSVCHGSFIRRLHFLRGCGAGQHSNPWQRRYGKQAAVAGLPTPAGRGSWKYGEPQ